MKRILLSFGIISAIVLILVICFFICYSKSNNYIIKLNKPSVDSIIKNNDYTLIFGWTKWCEASHLELKEHIIPFDREIHENVGFISICCANEEEIIDNIKENEIVYKTHFIGSYGGMVDKIRLNNFFKSVFKTYQFVDYVPIVLLCNSKGEILNKDNKQNGYFGAAHTILLLKNNYLKSNCISY